MQHPHPFSAIALFQAGGRYGNEVGHSILLAARRWKMDDASTMAAAVAYYLALSIFPMWLLLTAGVGMVLRFTRLGKDAESQIFAIVAEHCSPSLETQVRGLVLQLEDQATVGGPIGLATAVLAAIGVFYQFERGFDKIWRIPVPASRGIISSVGRILTERLVAFLLLVSVGALIVAILASNVALGALQQFMAELHIPGAVLLTVVDASATTVLNSCAFALLYRWLPKRPVRWRDAFRGGLLAAIVWEVGRQILGAFLIRMTYTTTYGATGSFIALLLWFYWGINILFFGAEYVQVLARRRVKPLQMFRPAQEALEGSTTIAIARRRTLTKSIQAKESRRFFIKRR